MISSKTYGQYYQIFQTVNVEQYRGKNFILEGKIFYKDKLAPDSWLVLTTAAIDDKNRRIGAPLNNESALDYYKQNDWSPYELIGKINKNAKYFTIGVSIAGKGSYYLDSFKLFVKEGKNKIEIPLDNSDLEDDSIKNWQYYNMDKDTKLSLSKDKVFLGKQSLFIDNSNVKVSPTLGNNPELGKYINVNGIKLYYEIYGKGKPLLLLHGNNSSMNSFSNQLDMLRKKYMVVCLDSRGQGKSSANEAKLTYELMAEDVNAFLDEMSLKNVNILGWSDGGNIALILAMKHQDKVDKMAVMGAVLYNDKSSVTAETNKLIHKQVKEMEEKGVSKTSMGYQLRNLLLTEPHINPDSLKKIQSPTLVMAGQYDVVKEKHTKLIAEKIPHGKLVIFKGADHEAPQKIPQLFNETISEFFDQDN